MTFIVFKNKFNQVILFALIAFILCSCFAPLNFEIFTWISLSILILIIDNNKSILLLNNLFVDGLVFGLFFFFPLMYWLFYSLYNIIHTGFIVAITAYILFCLTLSIFIGLIFYTYDKSKIHNDFINRVLLFPSIWVVFEWIRGWIFTGFGWFDIGYTQINNNNLKYFLPILGIYGLSWVIISISGALSIIVSMLYYKKNSNTMLLCLAYLFLIFIIGDKLSELNYTKPYGKKFSVALIQSNIGANNKWTGNTSIDYYAKTIATTKADIIITPETAITTFEQFLPNNYLNFLATIAKKSNSNLIVGIPVIVDKHNNYVNAAMLITNKKRPFYSKSHLVPFGEYLPFKKILSSIYLKFSIPMVGFIKGSNQQSPVIVANQKIAFNICYENGFGSELIYSAKNSTIIANISDMMWYGKTFAMYQHLQLSQARALENQRYFIQVTNSGITSIINNSGVIQSQLPPFKSLVLNDYVQGMIGTTPYQQYGNIPIIILCLTIYILLLLKITKYSWIYKSIKKIIYKIKTNSNQIM